MKTEVIMITPKIASSYLELNTNNRRLNESAVVGYSRAMKRGEWKPNGDTIRISESGILLDGQHRLAAIEHSGIPQEYIVVTGLPDSAFTTIDTGRNRTPAQMLDMEGVLNSSTIASAARLVLTYEKTGNPGSPSPASRPTHSEIVDFCKQSELLEYCAKYAKRTWQAKFIGKSVCGFCLYVFVKNSIKGQDFFDELVSGNYSYNDSPVQALREWLIEVRGSSSRVKSMLKIAMIFKAFNLYAQGKKRKIIRLNKKPEKNYLIEVSQ